MPNFRVGKEDRGDDFEERHVSDAPCADIRWAAEEYERRHKGSGKKITVRVTVEITCYNTEAAFESALRNFATYFKPGVRVREEDDILGFHWSASYQTL